MKKELTKILSQHHNVQFAYLFGSYADGTQKESSDIDIAVYLEDISLDAKLFLHHALEKNFHKEIDLITLNEVKNIYLLEAILHKGVMLKDGKNRAFFEVQKNHEIIDFKHFKRYIDAA